MAVDWSQLFFELLDILGTVSFALSGAMLAVKKRTDLFGVMLMGIVSAVGGGVTRDVLLGSVPPAAFTNSRYVLMAAATSAVLFLLARWQKEVYLTRADLVDKINNVADAIGLGAFSVTGVQTAAAAGYGNNIFFAVFLGVITGVGGGVLRDMMLGEVPFILVKRVYAVASILGALGYYLLEKSGVEQAMASLIGMMIVFCVRMLATHYRWNLPKAI